MKKRIFLLTLLSLSLISATGCFNKTTSTPNNNQTQKETFVGTVKDQQTTAPATTITPNKHEIELTPIDTFSFLTAKIQVDENGKQIIGNKKNNNSKDFNLGENEPNNYLKRQLITTFNTYNTWEKYMKDNTSIFKYYKADDIYEVESSYLNENTIYTISSPHLPRQTFLTLEKSYIDKNDDLIIELGLGDKVLNNEKYNELYKQDNKLFYQVDNQIFIVSFKKEDVLSVKKVKVFCNEKLNALINPQEVTPSPTESPSTETSGADTNTQEQDKGPKSSDNIHLGETPSPTVTPTNNTK